jgi:hypothetical protein
MPRVKSVERGRWEPRATPSDGRWVEGGLGAHAGRPDDDKASVGRLALSKRDRRRLFFVRGRGGRGIVIAERRADGGSAPVRAGRGR